MAAAPGDYSKLLYVDGTAELIDQTLATVAELRSLKFTLLANELAAALKRLIERLEQSAVTTAQRAHDYIIRSEQLSRVRPPTPDSTNPSRDYFEGGAPLDAYLGKSDALAQVPGAVGINDEAYLRDSPVYWWWTNEAGYDWRFHEETDIRGFFYDPGFTNMSAPDPGRSREHPLFSPTSGRGRVMHINEPIPARQFVLEGSERAARQWHEDVRSARAHFDADVARILGKAEASVRARVP